MKIPISKEGLKLIKIFLIFTICSYILGTVSSLFYFLFFILLIICLFLVYFFRDPERVINKDNNVILSPADGKVIDIIETEQNKTIKIFMSPFNVHIQRASISGKISSIEYKPGKFLPAYMPGSDNINEQNILIIKNTELNLEVIIKQIAGILVRRIVCFVKPDDYVLQGQRIGLIKFGSQVDLIVPNNVVLEIETGQKVKGGTTIIGRFSS